MMTTRTEPEQEPDVYIPANALRQLKGTSLLILRGVPLYGYRGDGLTPLYTTPPQRDPWVELMRGVRVEGDTVVISVKGGNEAARQLCGELVKEIEQ